MSDDEWAYLRDGFSSRTLRKEDLRRIFATHEVPYTNDMLKPQLLELFNTAIVPRRAELRERYVNVVPSGLNIVDAGSNSESESRNLQPPRSPRRLRPRTRSPSPPPPRRQRSPRRVASGGQSQASQTLESVPDLAPENTQQAPPSPRVTRAPRAPRSPRRHVNRKVELPGLESDVPTRPEVPLADIKIKAPPRSPRRRNGDDDDSFSNDNVFQSGRKRVSQSPEPSSKRSAKMASDRATAVPKPEPGVLMGDDNDIQTQPELPEGHNPSPDAVLLDEALVDALNAEVQWEQEQDSNPQHAADLRMMLDLVASDPDLVRSATEDVIADMNSTEALGEVPSSDIFEGSASELSRPSSEEPSRLPSTSPKASPNHTPAPRRRGFIPSFSELSVSRAFTEQLEPYMVASPIPTPRTRQTPAAQTPKDEAIPLPKPELRGNAPVSAPSSSSQQTPDAEVIDPEVEAAHALHEAVEDPTRHLPRWNIPRPHLRLPRPRLRLPRFRLPRPRLPNLRVPRFRVPRPALPRLPKPPLPRIPRARLPHVSKANISVPRPHLPRISPQILLQRLLQTLLSILGVATVVSTLAGVMWYRDALMKTEFCDVGAAAPHTYPEWTLVDVQSDSVASLQGMVRDAMDAAWPECVPCPTHAKCYQGRVMFCNSGYREALSPLAFGGLWPAPPRCLPDWEVQRKLEVLGERAAQHLRQRRANALCNEGDPEAALAAEELRALLHAQKAPQLTDEEFDQLWHLVLHRLPERYADVEVVRHVDSHSPLDSEPELTMQTSEHGGIRERAGILAASSDKITEDEASTAFLRSTSDALVPISCRVRLYLTGWMREHRTILLQISLSLVAIVTAVIEGWQWYRRRQLLQNRVESILQRLQQHAEKIDERGGRIRYLKVIDFRKEVPKQDWPALQRSVESNESVRVRQIEINGEITRVWEWTS